MKKVEILKVDCKPRKVHIYRMDYSDEKSYFVVYEGRRKVEQPYAFAGYYDALKRCMIVALGNSAYHGMTGGIS